MTKLHLKAIHNVYIRKDAPSTKSGSIKGIIYKDQEFDADVEIVQGELIDPGNPNWYQDKNGDFMYSGGFQQLQQISNVISNQPPPNWQIEKFGIKKIWDKTKGAEIKVAIIDSGLMIGHPEFNSKNIILTKNFLYSGNDDKLSKDVTDNIGHGTHCAGIIAARGLKVFGVAPEVKLLIGKIQDNNSDPIDRNLMTQAIKWAFENDADIISLSLTVDTLDLNYQQLISKLYNDYKPKGIIVGAIDNGKELNADTIEMYLPKLPECFGVGNIDDNNKIFRTVRCTYVDILAPGYNIFSTWNDGGYKTESGCSMAAPFVSGITALLLSSYNLDSKPIIREEILKTITDKTTSFASFNTKPDKIPIIDPLNIFSIPLNP